MSTIVHQRDVIKRPAFLAAWERARHSPGLHWFIECFAEALGVFFYCYAGVGTTASFVLGTLIKEPGLGSLLQIGFGYAFGIIFAITVCSATSGGHFNPCVTIAFIIFKGFPPLKGLRYIVAQILGAYIACLLVYAQWRDVIVAVEGGLKLAKAYDVVQFTAQGPAGIFALYVAPTAHMGRVFVNEFVCDIFLALVIWTILDPSNLLVPPAAGPWVIGFAYAVAIWGYSVNGLAANAARDIGGRLAAVTIWGTIAVGSKSYAAIAALTNIPATLVAALMYEFFLTDSDRVLGSGALEFIHAHKNHLRSPYRDASKSKHESSSDTTDEKGHVDAVENAHRV